MFDSIPPLSLAVQCLSAVPPPVFLISRAFKMAPFLWGL